MGRVLEQQAPLAAQASSLDKTLVLRVIKEKQAEYQKCYTEALSWNPQLKGRLLIRFTVESDGEVSSASEQAAAGETVTASRADLDAREPGATAEVLDGAALRALAVQRSSAMSFAAGPLGSEDR